MKPMTSALTVGLMIMPCTFAFAHDPWFARDKYFHGGVSAGLALSGYGAAALVSEAPELRLVAGGATALVAGMTKELLDLRGAGHASWRDMGWNVVGTASGLLIAWLLDRYVFVCRHPTSP